MKKITQKTILTWILLLTIFVFFLVNLLAGEISKRYHTALDLTEEKLYALSDQTLLTAQTLPDHTTVYVFSDRDSYPAMLREMLRRYEQLSSRLQVIYADPAENPMLMTHYRQMGAVLEEADMLVEGSRRIKTIPYEDLLLYEGGAPSGIDLEQQLSSALLYVHSGYAPRVLFTTGHGERPAGALYKLFTDNNYTVENKAIAVEDIGHPELMVIAGPGYDFSLQETELLAAYLSAGGKLMIFLEPAPAPMPNFSDFLLRWGMRLETGMVFEPKAFAAGSPHNLIPMYISNPVNEYFEKNPVYVVMPSSGAILAEGLGAGRVEPLLRTTTDSYLKKDLNYVSPRREEGDASGPYVLAALSGGQVFLSGSRMIYADDLMGTESYANRPFLAQVLGALWQEATPLSIPPKALSNAPLLITGEQTRILSVLLTAALPLGALAAGTIVWFRRKRL